MPKYLVELDDGRKFNVEADSPPSDDDLSEFMGSQQPAPEEPAQPLADTAYNALNQGFVDLAAMPVQAYGNVRKNVDALIGPTASKALSVALPMFYPPSFGAEAVGEFAGDVRAQSQADRPIDPRNAKTATIAGAIPTALGMAATGGYSAVAPLVIGGAMGAQQGFETADQIGVKSPLGKLATAGAFGAVEAGVERFGGFGGKGVVGGLVKKAVHGVGSETLEEVATGALQDNITRLAATDMGGDKTASGYDLAQLYATDPRYWQKRGHEALGGAVGGTIFAGIQALQSRRQSSIESDQSEVPAGMEATATPEQHREQMAAVVDAMEQSGADPDAIQFAVDQMNAAGPAVPIAQPSSPALPTSPSTQPTLNPAAVRWAWNGLTAEGVEINGEVEASTEAAALAEVRKLGHYPTSISSQPSSPALPTSPSTQPTLNPAAVRWVWNGLTAEGVEINGEVEASTEAAALAEVRKRGHYPTSISSQPSSPNASVTEPAAQRGPSPPSIGSNGPESAPPDKTGTDAIGAGSNPAAGATFKGQGEEGTGRQGETSPGPSTPPLPVSSSSSQDPEGAAAIKNKNVNAYREAVGLDPVESRGGSTQEEVLNQAMERVTANPRLGEQLVIQINESGHEADDVETAVLIYHEAQLRKQLAEATAAHLSAAPEAKAATKKIFNDALAAVESAHRAYRDTGTTTSDTFRARQMFARSDHSLMKMMQEYAALSDKPMTPEEVAAVTQASAALRATDAELAAKQEEMADEDVKAASEQILPGLKAAARANIAAADKRKLLDQVRTKAAAAKAAIGRSLGKRKAARSKPKAKVDGLPDHTYGEGIIPTMQKNGMLLSEPTTGGEWDWFNDLSKAADVLNQSDPMTPKKANEQAAAGENMDDPRVMRAWLYQNVFAEPGSGGDPTVVADGLNSGSAGGDEGGAAFDIGPAELGDAILAEIQGRIMSKESGDVEDVEARAEADLIAQEEEELGIGFDDAGVDSWEDKIIRESGQTPFMIFAFDPKLAAAYTVRGAKLIKEGFDTLAKWSGEMLRRFGEAVRPYLRRVWENLTMRSMPKLGGGRAMVRRPEAGSLDIGKGEWDRKRRGVLRERRREVAAKQREARKQEKLAGIRRNLVTAMVGEMAEGATAAGAVEKLSAEFGNEVFNGMDLPAMSLEAADILAALKARAARAQTPAGIMERARSEQRGVDHTLAKQLALAHIAANVKITEEALATAVQNDLSALVPDITLRETREALTDYGRTKKQSQDEIKKAQRELRQQATLKVKIEDAERGVAPLKTGLVRDKATAVVRELRAKLGDVMRKMGVAQTGPEQLATARSAVMSRLQNQIEEATRLINGKARPREQRAGIAYDAEMLALQKERDELRAYYADLIKPSESYAWNKQAERAAKASAEFYKRRIATGDLAAKGKGVGHPMSEATKAAKAEAAAAKAEFDALREAAGLPSKEANDRLLASLGKRARDLRAIIQAGAGPVIGPQNQARPTSAEVAAARAEVKRLESVIKVIRPAANRPRNPQSDAQRAAAAETATLRAIAQVERELAGEARPAGRVPLIKSSKQRALEAELESLRGIRDAAEAAKVPRRTADEIAHEKLQKRLKEQEYDYADKLRRGDFSTPTKRQIELTREELQLKYQRDQQKRKWLDAKVARELADAGAGRRAVDTVMKAVFFARSIVTGGEFSALGRQGKLAAFMNPAGFVKGAVRATFKALASEKAEFEVLEAIRTRENGLKGIYKKAGLALNDPTDYSAAMAEGQARSAWMRDLAKVSANPVRLAAWWIEATGRAYTAGIAQMRADEFDRMAAKYERRYGEKPTMDQYRNIATMVNDATGAGKIGVGNGRYVASAGVKNFLGLGIFSPAFWASRFRLLTAAPALESAWRRDPRLLRMVGEEYGKIAAGFVVYGLFIAALGKMLWPDEDKKVEKDPRSGGFGKIAAGPASLDISAGLGTEAVHLARQITGEMVKNGEVVPMTGPDRPYGGAGRWELFNRQVRGKLAPIPSSLVNWGEGKDVLGNPTTLKGEMLRQFSPMTYGSIYDEFKTDPNKLRAGILSGMAMFGEGVNVRKPRP